MWRRTQDQLSLEAAAGEGGGLMLIPANQASSVNTDMLVAAGLLPMAPR
jgi:hypothetical protein